jgi:hypothetical protein
MVYRKGERKIDHTACGWPHQVWVPRPRSAADRQALEDFCKDMRMCDCQPLRRRGRVQCWVRCFSTKDEAQRVAEHFGGEYRTVASLATVRDMTSLEPTQHGCEDQHGNSHQQNEHPDIRRLK